MGYTYAGTDRTLIEAPAPKPPVFDPSKCGTLPGYKQHARYGVPRCLSCRVAKSRENAAQYAARRAA